MVFKIVQNGREEARALDLFGNTSEPRKCQYRKCRKTLPAWKNKKAKFCDGTCRIAEYHEKEQDRMTAKGKVRYRNFVKFHESNPHVYDELVKMARQLKAKGRDRFGIDAMHGVLRWRQALKTIGDEYKLNNNHRPYYSRLIMAQEPDLKEFFETREQKYGEQTKTP